MRATTSIGAAFGYLQWSGGSGGWRHGGFARYNKMVAFFDKKWVSFDFRVLAPIGVHYLAHTVPDLVALEVAMTLAMIKGMDGNPP
jgi:hypothetical protein